MSGSKIKLKIAVVVSESPALARKDFDLGLALHYRGHEVTVIFGAELAVSLDEINELANRGIKVSIIETESSVEYSYKVHLGLMAGDFSVAVGHSYKAPLYFEAGHGGTPLVVIHEDSYLFDPLKVDEVVSRNALWTQHVLQLCTLKASERVVVYSSQSAEALSRSGIRAEVLEEPVELSLGESAVENRMGLVVVCNGKENAGSPEFIAALESNFKSIDWVRPETIYENREIFRKAFAALVLCDALTLDILKYGCTVVRLASKEENFEGVAYVSPEEGEEAYIRGLSALFGTRLDEQTKLRKILSRRSYAEILDRRLEQILFDAVPEALVRGRIRGW